MWIDGQLDVFNVLSHVNYITQALILSGCEYSIFKYQQKLINFSSVHILPSPPCAPPRSITTMFVLSPVDVIILRQCCCLCCNNWTVLHNVDLCG